jgi:hypothetical protein
VFVLRSNPVCYCGLLAICLAIALPQRTLGQGMQTTLHAGPRVFPSIGPGVAAIKRDSAGRYFILAQPATTISVYDSTGKLVGQIPNANSRGATIHYAVDIDVDPANRVFVVDRGANAIKIFAADGSLVATIPVNAPTSLVALSGGQFAVTTLVSKRLVQIMDESGKVVRTFGDPADIAPPKPAVVNEDGTVKTTPPPPLADRGRIFGDQEGNIYFSFTSLPDPTLQRFDRYGYSAYEAVVPKESFGGTPRDPGRVEVGYSMSALGWPTSISAWTDLHSLTSLSAGGGAMHRGMRGGGVSAGGASGFGSSSSSSGSDSGIGNITAQGNTLAFQAGDSLDALDSSDYSLANSISPGDFNGPPPGGSGFLMPGMFGMGIGGFFHGHSPGMFENGIGGSSLGAPGTSPNLTPGAAPSHADESDHPMGEDGRDHFHFHPGFDEYRARVAVRVRLDTPPPGVNDKPVITAAGVDPETKEVWATIGDTLVHFDSGGGREEMYYLLLTDGSSLKATSIVVEPNRLLIAADPFGIYEFPRPDKPAPASQASNASNVTGTIVPAQASSAPNPHRRPLSQSAPAPSSTASGPTQ